MMTLLDLLSSRVQTRDGRDMGRVFDIRSAGEPEHGLTREEREATWLIYGYHGWMEVFGFRKTEGRHVPWERVVHIEPGKIVIADED